jgi:2-haloacid dehalogenase
MAAASSGPRPRLEALAFDAYGTLFDVFSVTSLCDRLFPGQGPALATQWRAKQLQYSLLRSLMGRHRDFWQVTSDALVQATRNLRLNLSPEAYRRLMDAYLSLTPFPDVKPGLERLRARGLKIAILSNGAPAMLDAAAGSAGLIQLLDVIISVEEAGTFKPAPQVYALASERLGVVPTAIGFVSSNNWDIQGARSAGLYTFWLQRNQAESEEELGFPSQEVVTSVEDLAARM